VLSLFPSSLFPVQADFGVALAVSDPSHAQVHTDFAALAVEVSEQLLLDVGLIFCGNVGVVGYGLFVDAELVLSSQLHLALLLYELGSGDLTYGAAELSVQLLGGVNITTNTANKLFHNFSSKYSCFLIFIF
jgi:hypothetical protein